MDFDDIASRFVAPDKIVRCIARNIAQNLGKALVQSIGQRKCSAIGVELVRSNLPQLRRQTFLGRSGHADFPPRWACPVGDEALTGAANGSAPPPLLGLQRLLGRKYDSLGGARWLEREADELFGCSLEAEGAEARLRLTFARPAPSGLKRRGASDVPSSRGGAAKAPKSATIDKLVAPEEALTKLLLKVKARAQASLPLVASLMGTDGLGVPRSASGRLSDGH